MNVRIKSFSIDNYRSCKHCGIELDKTLSVFIGPNGSGKTNLLTAFTLLKKLSEFDERRYHSETQFTVTSRLQIEFGYGQKSIRLDATIDLYTGDRNADVIVHARQMWDLRDFRPNSKRVQAPLSAFRALGNPKGKFKGSVRDYYATSFIRASGLDKYPKACRDALHAIYEFISHLKYYGASQFIDPTTNPVAFEIEEEGSRNYATRGSRAQIFLDMYNAEKMPSHKKYDEFINILGKDGIRLIDKIEFKDIKTSSIEHTVRSGGNVRIRRRSKKLIIPQFTIGKQLLSPNQLSEGSFKTIAFLFYLITDNTSLLLLEEPEVCIHHGLLESIVELIKVYSQRKQIIMSTHSDFVLDRVKPHNVFKVSSSSKDGTQVSRITEALSAKELEALKEYLATEGNLGEYWRHGRLG